MVDLCFNELCLRKKANSLEQAKEWLTEMIDLLRFTRQWAGTACKLRTMEDFHSLEVCKGWAVAKCANQLDRERCRFFLSQATKSPYLRSEDDSVAYGRGCGLEMHLKGEQAPGLCAAYLLDGVAISFPSDEMWNSAHLAVNVLELQEDGRLVEESATVRHAAALEHMTTHQTYYCSADYLLKEISTWKDLQDKRGAYFPSLVFGDEFFRQISRLPMEPGRFSSILRKLHWLNRYFCGDHTRGEENLAKQDCSKESLGTMQLYGEERIFAFRGKKRCCDWHIKLGKIRIHFCPDFSQHKAYVGYIGKHLRIASMD